MSAAEPAEAVLAFWFVETPAEQRFARDDTLDAACAARFGALHAELARGVPDAWQATPRTLLAAVIVLDQFSRNLFRDDPRAFAQDAAARALTDAALARGDDAALTDTERQFLYMPLMHSEKLADQDRCVALFAALDDREPLAFAQEHRDVIARFGRFPSRNKVLGRASTPDELAFLAANPAGF